MYMFLRYSSENVTSVYLYGSVQHTVCCARLRMCVHFSVIFSCSNKFRCELSERPTCTFGRKLRKVIIFKGIRATVPYFPLNVIEINRIFLVKMELLWIVLCRLEMVNLIWIDF